jgi:hypothetical protein
MHDLDGDPTVECRVHSEKHHPHPSTAELALEAILRPQRGLKYAEEIEGGIAHVRKPVRVS